MSTAESPKQETAERLAEASPMLLLPRMIELVHHNKSRKSFRDRLNDAHRAGTAAMRGEPIPEPIESDPEEMGDSFSIQGDTVQHYYPPQPPEATQPEQPGKPSSGWLGKSIVAVALLASGAGLAAGIPYLASLLNPPAQEQPADPGFVDTDTTTQIKVW